MAKSNGPKKITLQVTTRHTPDGGHIPHQLSYNDETFEIKNPVRSLKLFDGAGWWRCTIDGQPLDMFNLGELWWKVESVGIRVKTKNLKSFKSSCLM